MIDVLSGFLDESNIKHVLDTRLKPPRILFERDGNVVFAICVCNGEIYLEDVLENVTSNRSSLPIRIDLADPKSLDLLLDDIRNRTEIGREQCLD